MGNTKFGIIIFCFLIVNISSSFAQLDTLVLLPKDTSYLLLNPFYTEWEDPSGRQTFADILSLSKDFKKPTASQFSNPNLKSAYWYKLHFTNHSIAEAYYLVSHNYGLNEIDVYWIDDKQREHHSHFDRETSIYDRPIVHRQPVFNIGIKEGESKEIYVRIKNRFAFGYTFELYSLNRFLSYYTIEYLLFGVFYGMLIFVVLYNFSLYLSLRQGYLLALVIYTLVQIVCMSLRDGTAIFFFLRFSDWMHYLDSVLQALFFTLLTWYCILYLDLKKEKPVFFFLISICSIRMIVGVLEFEYKEQFIYHLNILILGSCMVFALFKWAKKDPLAKYIFWGVFSLTVTYFIYYLSLLKIIPVNHFSFFSLYFGVVGESIFFTLASSEKIKLIKIGHMQIQRMNRDLETLVNERTKTIKEQNGLLEQKAEELNQFLYKSSHDLKGPIKSIEGLCLVAKLEKPEKHAEYLQKIYERTQVLGTVISDLNQVMLANNVPTTTSLIDFETLHEDICHLFEAFPGYTETEISFLRVGSVPFYSDKKLMASIYQNLLENGIKYRDKTKKSTLAITIDSQEAYCSLIFQDNGIGIPKELQNKVFEMFFKANDSFQDSNGLGLYLVKVSVEKLNGQIWIDSEVGEGTVMKIVISK